MTLPYTKDQLDDAFIAGQRSANSHDKMSDETKQQFKIMGEDITNLKIGQTKLDGKMDLLLQISNSNHQILTDHIKEEGQYRDKQDKYHTDMMEKKADKEAVDDLKDNQKWVIRSIIGIVISAVLGLIIVK
jgi:uncharacterized coiled-coil DUF342 family protein